MSIGSPTAYLLWSILSTIVRIRCHSIWSSFWTSNAQFLIFLVVHLWLYDRFNCVKWDSGRQPGAFRRVMTYVAVPHGFLLCSHVPSPGTPTSAQCHFWWFSALRWQPLSFKRVCISVRTYSDPLSPFLQVILSLHWTKVRPAILTDIRT